MASFGLIYAAFPALARVSVSRPESISDPDALVSPGINSAIGHVLGGFWVERTTASRSREDIGGGVRNSREQIISRYRRNTAGARWNWEQLVFGFTVKYGFNSRLLLGIR